MVNFWVTRFTVERQWKNSDFVINECAMLYSKVEPLFHSNTVKRENNFSLVNIVDFKLKHIGYQEWLNIHEYYEAGRRVQSEFRRVWSMFQFYNTRWDHWHVNNNEFSCHVFATPVFAHLIVRTAVLIAFQTIYLPIGYPYLHPYTFRWLNSEIRSRISVLIIYNT